MSTQASTPYLLRRVAVRAGVGVWRHRGGVLLAAAVTLALSGYVAVNGVGDLSMGLSAPLSAASAGAPARVPLRSTGQASASTDCADTAMAAIADKSPSVAQRAYQCMDPTLQQRVSEQAFVQQMQTQQTPTADKMARVGDYRTPTGGTMVYYALDGGGQSIGYVVYLGQNGKVMRIE
jgi:hypothetical protein